MLTVVGCLLLVDGCSLSALRCVLSLVCGLLLFVGVCRCCRLLFIVRCIFVVSYVSLVVSCYGLTVSRVVCYSLCVWLSVVCCLLCVVYCLLFVVCLSSCAVCLFRGVYCSLCVVCCLLVVVCCMWLVDCRALCVFLSCAVCYDSMFVNRSVWFVVCCSLCVVCCSLFVVCCCAC